jgi:tripartite-type tricarboxylate transporter receptor subunit TctC
MTTRPSGRRRFVAVAGAALASPFAHPLAALAQSPQAAAWPQRAIRMIAPLGPGTSVDTVARLAARGLGDALGQSVIVENRPGGSGNIASELVAKAPPDGHTLLCGNSALTILPATTPARAIDPLTAFAPVALLVTQPLVLVAHPAFKGTTFADVVRMAKERPGEIAFSTSGVGGNAHLTAVWVMARAQIRLLHVPYTANRALTDVLSGEIPLAFSFSGTVLPMIRAGQLKAIAVTSAKRIDAAPDIATFSESGLPGFEVANWQGVLAPAGTPPEIVGRLSRELLRVFAAAELRERLEGLGFDTIAGDSAEFAALIRAESVRWKKVVAESGLRFES